MRFDVLTLFPEAFDSPLAVSIVGQARESGIVSIHLHNIRDWTDDKHHTADDTPYGGGGGMVMKPEPVVRAVRAVRAGLGAEGEAAPVIYLSPQGALLTAKIVDELAALPEVILLCGNYEGIDERAIELVVTREISIGDYVLTGGELPAMVLINAIVRKLPGALGNQASAQEESFEKCLLDFPHYTRPEEFEGKKVPEVLLSGHHAKVDEWRRREALRRTVERRPDLLIASALSEQDYGWLAERNAEEENH